MFLSDYVQGGLKTSIHGPKSSEGLTITTFTRIAAPIPTVVVTVDIFQSRKGSEGLKATMASLEFRVTVPGLLGNGNQRNLAASYIP